jgi:hypothetical protein
MNERLTLFIGGIADGERYLVPASMERFRVSKSDPNDEPGNISRNVIVNIYRRMPVGADDFREDVFVLESMSNADVMKCFIAAYNPGGELLEYHPAQAEYHATRVRGLSIEYTIIDSISAYAIKILYKDDLVMMLRFGPIMTSSTVTLRGNAKQHAHMIGRVFGVEFENIKGY